MPRNPHIIGKQFLEIRQHSREDALARQQEMLNLFKRRLLPEMEAIFDRYAGPDVVIRIDRLDLDLGSIPYERLESEWVEQLRKHLPEALEHYLSKVPVTEGAFPEAGGKPDGREVFFPGEEGQEYSVSRASFDAWLRFLRTGTLPWWFPSGRVGEWESELEKTLQIPAARTALRSLLRSRAGARSRLLRQMSQGILFQVFQLLQQGKIPLFEAFYREVLGWLEEISGNSGGWQQAQLNLNAATLRLLLREAPWEEEDLLRAWIKALPDPFLTREVYRALKAQKARGEEEASRKWQSNLLEALEREKKTSPGEWDQPGEQEGEGPSSREFSLPRTRPSRVSGEAPASGNSAGKETDSDGSPSREEAASTKEQFPEEKEALLAEGLYLSNAGLVLLHPFLEAYFEQVGLLGKRGFRSSEAHARAVLLTQYLVSGARDLPEYDLLLNKLLCGFSWEDPLPRSFDPTDEEQSVTEELLKAAIGHWKALKGSSPAALQEGFLQRAGKLSRDGRGLHLQVEQSGIDVLLGSLPWSIGIVKTPWMEEMLYVDWA